MPKLPQLNATRGITGNLTSSAPTSAFDSGGGQGSASLAGGVFRASQTLSAISQQIQAREEKRQKQLDASAVNTALNDYNLKVTNYLNENRTDPNAAATLEFARKTIGESTEGMSEEAARAFSERAESSAISTYASVSDVQFNLGLKKQFVENEEQAVSMMAAFRNTLESSGIQAAGTFLAGSLAANLESMDEQWSDSPELADKQKEMFVKQAIIGASQESPELAQALLDEYDIFDASTRKTLEGYIEGQKNEIDSIGRTKFQASLKRTLFQANDTRTFITQDQLPSEAEIARLYPDTAVEVLDSMNKAVDTHNQAMTDLAETKGWAPWAIEGKIAELRETQKSLLNDKSYEADVMVGSLSTSIPLLQESMRRAQGDPVEYLYTDNPAIEELERSKEGKEGAELAEIDADIYALLRQYQSAPPLAVTEEEQKRYMNLDTDKQHNITKRKAEDDVSRIRNSDPTEVPGIIAQFLARYPNKREARLAFEGLVKLPDEGKQLHPAYQVMFWVEDEAVAQRLASRLKFFGEIKDVSAEKITEYQGHLWTDPNWENFKATMIDTNPGDVKAFQDALIAYAIGSKESPANSIKEVSQLILGNVFSYPEVAGETVQMPRHKRDGELRSDKENEDITRGLKITLQNFDMSQVDFSDVRNWGELPENKESRDMVIAAKKNNLYFKPLSDSQTAVIMVQGSEGFDFELRGKDGQPFIVDFDVWELAEIPTIDDKFPQEPGPFQPSGEWHDKRPQFRKYKFINR